MGKQKTALKIKMDNETLAFYSFNLLMLVLLGLSLFGAVRAYFILVSPGLSVVSVLGAGVAFIALLTAVMWLIKWQASTYGMLFFNKANQADQGRRVAPVRH